MRLFIAIYLDDKILAHLASIQCTFKKYGKCPPKENLHLTLKFLGEVKDPQDIITALQEVTLQPFDLSLSHIDSFETGYHGTIIWVTFAESKELILLKKKIDHAIPALKDDHPFKAHITLVRAGLADKKELQNDLKNTTVEPLQMIVRSFSLVKSELLPGGSKYTTLATFSLLEEQ
jgi:2'-5' RNA ligase